MVIFTCYFKYFGEYLRKILIIHSDKEMAYYLKFLVDGIEESDFTYRESLQEVLETENGLFDVHDITICEFNIIGFTKLLEKIKEDNKISLITAFNAKNKELFNETIEYHPQISGYQIDKGETYKFRTVYKRTARLSDRNQNETKYCKIRADYFLNFTKVVCDVFIKISDEKYVRIIARHQEYDNDEIEKYKGRDIHYFYIKEVDYKIFINAITKFFTQRSQEKLPKLISNKNLLPTVCHETVHEIISKIGINEQALILTNNALNETFSLIEKNDIFKLLKSTLHQNSFISEFSMLTSYISCAVCKESDLSGPENFLRLSLAAFFADISLDNDELAKVETLNELNISSDKKKKIILNHPIQSAKILEKIDGLPLGVDNIIIKHHERYDGSGFPRGIDYTRIEPLCVIFIISCELAYTLYDTGYNRDIILGKILDMEEKYIKGSFPKMISAMKAAFSIPLIDYDDKEGLH